MLRKTFLFFALGVSLSSLAAQESVLYLIQPNALTIFLNGVAYVRDEVVIAGGSSASIALPANLFKEMLAVREGDTDTETYTLNTTSGMRMLTNFGAEALTVKVVDHYPTDAQAFTFSTPPVEEGGNILRWIVELPADETTTLTYQFEAMY